MSVSRRVILVALLVAGCADSSATSTPRAAVTTGVGATSAPVSSSDVTTAAAAGADVQHLTFTAVDGTVVDYVLLVPPGRALGQSGKVLLAFPPSGQDLAITEQIVQDVWRDDAIARGWVVVSPAAPSTGPYLNDTSVGLVSELLDEIAAEYPPEGGRFDLAGVSSGGLSAFMTALAYPERFRSLVVFPGYPPNGGDDPNLAKLKEIGVFMFVGGDDTQWLDACKLTEQTLKGLGYIVELHVFAGEQHIPHSLTSADIFDAIERIRS